MEQNFIADFSIVLGLFPDSAGNSTPQENSKTLMQCRESNYKAPVTTHDFSLLEEVKVEAILLTLCKSIK